MAGIWQTILFEKRCLACGQPFLPCHEQGKGGFFTRSFAPEAYFCTECLGNLPVRASGFCPYCGFLGADRSLPSTPCGACIKKLPPWGQCLFYAEYEGLLGDLLKRFKFNSQTSLSNALAALLFHKIHDQVGIVDLVLPVPLHNKRLQHRGYNQALLLSRSLQKMLVQATCGEGQAMGKPAVRCDILMRHKHTRPQVGLSREERFNNTKGIFIASPQVAGASVLLVDDIYTTGATMHAACETLLEAGASKVNVAVIAHT